MPTWWLVLLAVGGNGQAQPPMHVGNFSSLASCQQAANSAAPVDTVPNG